jgi:hypothetical protein
MSPSQVHLLLFSITAVVFAVVGFRAAREQGSAKDYFRNPSPWKNAVSLTASNITLGTGLVYLISGAQQLGTLLLLAPWALLAGYAVLGLLVEKAAKAGLGQGKNLLADVNERIVQATGKPCSFAKVISGVLSMLLVALLAFEIFASVKVITPLLLENDNVRAEIVLSIVFFAITMLYTILGGISAVLAVDFLQVPLILLFLPAFVWIGIFSGDGGATIAGKLAKQTHFSVTVLVATGGAIINAFAGQFFSLLNIGAVSQVAAHERRVLSNRVGFLTALILSLFVLVGICLEPAGDRAGWPALMSRFVTVSQSGGWGVVTSSIVVLGMASILLTTTDAVVFSSIMFWYDNVTGRDSTSVLVDRAELRSIRRIGAVVFTGGFGLLAALNYFQPDPFYFLLSLAGGVSVLAPAIVLALILGCDLKTARGFTPGVFRVFLFFLAISCVGNAVLVTLRSPWVATLTTVMFMVSVGFAAVVWRKSRFNQHEGN